MTSAADASCFQKISPKHVDSNTYIICILNIYLHQPSAFTVSSFPRACYRLPHTICGISLQARLILLLLAAVPIFAMNETVDNHFVLLGQLELNPENIYVNNRKHDICALLGNYATYSGNSLPTFRDVSVTTSRSRNPKRCIMSDFRLPPRSRWDLPSSGKLSSV
jgi:hypothetical protein